MSRISDALEANSVEVVDKNLPQPYTEDKDTQEDYNLVRETLRKIISKSDGVLDDMIGLASEAEHPRAYEVLGGLMKSTAEVASQLMDLQKARQALEERNSAGSSMGHETINNNLFVGSTEDLQRFIAAQKKKSAMEIIDV